MFHLDTQRCLVWLLIILLSVCQPAAIAADSERDRERAAMELLSEALVVGEWDREPRFFPAVMSADGNEKKLYQRILKEYPATKAARVAAYSYAYSLLASRSRDEAVSVAKSIVAQRPGTVDAAWAHIVLGKTGPRKGGEAVREWRNVAATLPNRADLGPFNQSRYVLGQWCEKYLANRADVIDAADYLGLDKTDERAEAETLAIVAAYRAADGQFDAALPVLERLVRDCPKEAAEINWARCRVAIAYLHSTDCQGPLAGTMVKWLSEVPQTTGDDLSAEACLWLARYYGVRGLLSEAVSVLGDGKQRYAATSRGAQILYGLGSVLDRQGKRAEGLATMKELVESKSLEPFYAPMAEFFISHQATLSGSAPVSSSIKESESRYDKTWRFLAYSPADTMLDTGWMVAAQATALVKDDRYEDALSLVTSSLSRLDVLAARGEVLLSSMRSVSDLGRLLREQADVLQPLLQPRLDPTNREGIQVRCALLDAALGIVTQADASRCSPESKRDWLAMLAGCYARAGRPHTAVKVYKLALSLSIPGTSLEDQARLKYRMAMCYWEMNYRDSARAVMKDLSEHYADTSYAKQATRTMNGWKVLEELEKEKAQQQGETNTTAE